MAGDVSTLTFPNNFVWIDMTNPTRRELDAIAKQYQLHSTSVKDCLDPEHLPKFEKFPQFNFTILRAFDEKSTPQCDTVQELTRKIAIFSSDKFIITVHRKDQPFLAALRAKWAERVATKQLDNTAAVLSDILHDVFLSYEKPIDEGLTNLEGYEMGIFGAEGTKPFRLKDGYYLKRRAFVFKRILRYSQDVLTRLQASGDVGAAPFYQDLRETLDGTYFYADELLESINGLLNLHISLSSQKTNEASHRTNEVVRVLTIFSVFFMPLNFIAGIYGMNFEHMPELKHEHGYFVVLGLMFAICIIIYLWFRNKGWLNRN
jgi:magnesium transporter